MTSVAYIVDGDLEKRFLSENCKGSPIRRVGNGDRFPVHVIAKQVMTQIKLLSNRVQNFVLLMDLEDRQQTPGEFAAAILQELRARGLGNQNIVIVIKEREIEDWILSDPESIGELVGVPVDTAGLTGKGDLSRLLRQYNIKYNEVTIGCDMLKSVHCSRAAARSGSLSYLKDNFPAECWWVSR